MKLVKIILKTDKKFENRDAEKVRGFFGNYFKENVLFHNHKSEYRFNYDFSFIQYKVKNGQPLLLGIDRGADTLIANIEKIKQIKIANEIVDVTPEINITFPEIKIDEELNYEYKFETIWLALNDRNFQRYKNGELNLNQQLANNILEFLKMCGVWSDKRIVVSGDFKEITLKQKEVTIIGFTGEFKTNVYLPDDISLGKRKSIGMGRIRMIKEGKN